MITYRAIPGATKSATVTTGTVSTMSDFSFDSADLTRARRAIVSTITNDLMITWSAVDPTSTLGHGIAAAAAGRAPTSLRLRGVSIVDLRFLALSGSATVTITLER